MNLKKTATFIRTWKQRNDLIFLKSFHYLHCNRLHRQNKEGTNHKDLPHKRVKLKTQQMKVIA